MSTGNPAVSPVLAPTLERKSRDMVKRCLCGTDSFDRFR